MESPVGESSCDAKWGNPWRISRRLKPDQAVARFAAPVAPALNVAALRGKNLACWCPLDRPCHVDVLLTLANESPDTT